MPKNTYKRLIVLIFVLIALPTGVFMAMLTPPGQVPDEQAHVARALGLLHGGVLAVRKPTTDPLTQQPTMRTGVKVDIGLVTAAASPMTMIGGNPIMTADNFRAWYYAPDNHNRIYVDLPNTAQYFPLTYLPATLAFAAGIAAKATPAVSFMLARLTMLGTFVLLGALALWFAAYGEAVLLTILLLPMTLFLAGSVSQDALIVAITCLVCALLSRNSRTAWLAALLLFLSVLLSKPPYIPLLAVFLLPLSSTCFWPKLRGLALACIPLLIWTGLVMAFVAVAYPIPLYHPGPLYHGDASIWLDHAAPKINFHILLADPSRLIAFPWKTQQIWFPDLMREMTGVLGLLRISLPMVDYYLWAACAAAALIGLMLSPRAETLPRRTALANVLISSAAIITTYWLITILFYVYFTDAGGDSTTGLQGRYFLPLLPFLIFTLPALHLRLKPSQIAFALPALLMGLYDIGYLPLTIVRSFYLH